MSATGSVMARGYAGHCRVARTTERSVQTLEGTDKDGVEHLLERAVENLKK